MIIAVIGAGNVGGALAKNWAKAGHEVIIGAKDPNDARMQTWKERENTTVLSISQAAQAAEVVLFALPADATVSVAKAIGGLSGKVVIDSMNAVRAAPEGYASTFDALKDLSGGDVVKCFNSTGFENMADPSRFGQTVEMYMAGGSDAAQGTVKQLAIDCGFADCISFGDDSRVPLLEQFALAWINLAFGQGLGRGFAFKMLK